MSVQATHTPGPWSVRPRESRYTTLGNGAQIWSGQVHVASVTMKADKPFFQKRADAYLIAAAPDLVTELRDLVDWLEANQRTIEGMFSMDELLAGPRAALAKALSQGESADA